MAGLRTVLIFIAIIWLGQSISGVPQTVIQEQLSGYLRLTAFFFVIVISDYAVKIMGTLDAILREIKKLDETARDVYQSKHILQRIENKIKYRETE